MKNLKLEKNNIKEKIKDFIKNKKGSDMGAGTIVAIIAVVVFGFLFINKFFNFLDLSFLPEVFQSFMDMLHFGR